MRVDRIALVCLLGVLVGCDGRGFWGTAFLDSDERNCERSGRGCPAGQGCDVVSKVCKPVVDGGFLCASSAECTMDDRPACGGVACGPCDQGRKTADADAACMSRGLPTSRLCMMSGPSQGRCRECRGAEDCRADPTRPVCDAGGLCRACDGPADCPQSGVCRLTGAVPDPGGVPVGACVPLDKVCFVDPDGCAGGSGQTVCSIDAAIGKCAYAVLRPRKSGAKYPPFTLSSGSLVLVGPGRDQDALLTSVVASGMATSLTLIDVAIESGDASLTGASCDNKARLNLLRSRVRRSGVGIATDRCTLDLERSLVTDNSRDGIRVGLMSDFQIVNTLIAHNAQDAMATAVGVSLASAGRFAYNTVADNGRAGLSGGVSCELSVDLQDSIVAGNSTSRDKGSQFQSQCNLKQVAVGADPISGGITDAVILQPLTYRLTADSRCCIDRGKGADVKLDYEGTVRPQGPAPDIGFNEWVPR